MTHMTTRLAQDRPGTPATPTPWGRCSALFAAYPEAAWHVAARRLRGPQAILIKDPDADRRYWQVTRHLRDRGPAVFQVRSRNWRGHETTIETGTPEAAVPAELTGPLAAGLPVPRDGALYACAPGGGEATALMTFATDPGRVRDDPHFAVLVRGTAAPGSWPPFTRERVFGAWFWQARQAGLIVPVWPALTRLPGRVYKTRGRIAVDGDLRLPGGLVIREGVYLHPAEAAAPSPLPTARELLSDPSRLDLARQEGN